MVDSTAIKSTVLVLSRLRQLALNCIRSARQAPFDEALLARIYRVVSHYLEPSPISSLIVFIVVNIPHHVRSVIRHVFELLL